MAHGLEKVMERQGLDQAVSVFFFGRWDDFFVSFGPVMGLDEDFGDQWMKFSLVFSFGDGMGVDGKSKKESKSYYPKVDIQSFIWEDWEFHD